MMKSTVTSRPAPADPGIVRRDAERALAEDIGSGDVTAELLSPDARADALVITREPAVLAGTAWFDACFNLIDPRLYVKWHFADGCRVGADDVLCKLSGSARSLVSGERCALNFLQTLSATATSTARHVAAVAGTRARILDTRKTLPGLRHAQKYAVRCGGGENHRSGLFDALLIKENHIQAAGSIEAAVRRSRAAHPRLLLEVEVENIDEMRRALDAGVDRIMLDEFSIADIVLAVHIADGRVPLEVSGGVHLDALPALAATGVDFISIGALTKNVRAIDLSMRIVGGASAKTADQSMPR